MARLTSNAVDMIVQHVEFMRVGIMASFACLFIGGIHGVATAANHMPVGCMTIGTGHILAFGAHVYV